MKMTYTQHRLTHSQLERLAPIVKGRPHLHGMALVALQRKCLVEAVPGERPPRYVATEAGVQAFHDARGEGW
ncbi:MAG: hypothetical protein C9356_14890 [Oleiphilus sp.]|nr:MAG: hypothetical protein C9356_14890 [Oleiphilus sp.]